MMKNPADKLMVEFEQNLKLIPQKSLMGWLLVRFLKRFCSERLFIWILFPLFGSICRILDYIFPKSKNTIIFGSNGGMYMTGSPHALFRGIHKRFANAPAYYMQLRPCNPFHLNPFSLRSLIIFLSAKHIVYSHGVGDFVIFRPSSRKTHYLTWHGMVMKNAGYLLDLSPFEKKRLKEVIHLVDYVIASSNYDVATLSLAFHHPVESFKVIGQARNDSLVHPTNSKASLAKYCPHLLGDEFIVLYAPTWRDTGAETVFFPFDDFDYPAFLEFLRARNIVVLIRRHVNDTKPDAIIDGLRILNFDFDVCPDIYSVLPSVDLLLTDYSSIALDYLLLDRPIGYIPYDIDEFREERGFVFDDYEFLTAGPKLDTMADLTEFLDNAISRRNDEYRDRRNELCRVVHAQQTSDTVTRFIHLLLSSACELKHKTDPKHSSEKLLTS